MVKRVCDQEELVMNCSNCNTKMTLRSKHTWSSVQKKYVKVFYWWCPSCGTYINV